MPTRASLAFTAVGLITLGALVLAVHRLVAPHIVGRAVSPDGVEMCVLQKFNWGGEPYTTSFVFRRPGSTWGWCYFDHEDNYWGVSRVVLDTNQGLALFYRDNQPAIRFNWQNETYWRGNQVWSTGAQHQLSADWSPERWLRNP